MRSRVKVICRGIVQGIGFRPFVYQTAMKLGLTGFVRNQGDAGVLIVAEGLKEILLKFVDSLKYDKPYLAKYEDFQVTWSSFQDQFAIFEIQKSSKQKVGGVSYLPPDISLCDKCLSDMENQNDYRYKYAFTSCAICGPRYTTITKLPYDRPNTTMKDFPLCESCSKEYNDPLDRRHHAQTTCCVRCGPKLSLYNKSGKKLELPNVIKEISKLISEGNIIAIKGIGGTHLACSVNNDETILKLRTRKGKRKYKPFAVISRSIADVEKYAVINSIEEELLTSYRRPIVLLDKKEPFPLSEWIAPKLYNIGVMLPYSGIHSLILDEINDPALILTSANPSEIPMYIENDEILENAGELADYFLLHNRRIFQRADDSVLRFANDNPVLIRRSRGWVPEPINLPFDLGKFSSLGVGPLLTSTGAIATTNRCFPTQFIGDVETLETLAFLESSINHMSSLLDINSYDSIGSDLHPNFLSSKLAEKIKEEHNASLYKIQHHHAHAVALMLDNHVPKEEDIVSIIADGVGYGSDGKIWGGEIFHSSYSDFKRIGHLEEQPMIGGDRATYFPIRMVIGILSKKYSENELSELLLKAHPNSLPGGENEIQIALSQLNKGINVFYSTSTGRILAAASALLKACYERTYEGEPAIILEALARKGRLGKIEFEVFEENTEIIDTTSLLHQAYELLNSGKQPADIALAIHHYLANQFSDLAINYAISNAIKKIGFTGGVAYNDIITRQIAKKVKSAKLEFLQHKSLPCGDGGISSGQAIIAAMKAKD
ncbi:MAG: carbamoyltransferase HypF [Candidatus Heimdallarchaeota archaeon]|nr:carbamoyltransferase HypF [Candidatus Heimdallarchaeota archaeon]